MYAYLVHPSTTYLPEPETPGRTTQALKLTLSIPYLHADVSVRRPLLSLAHHHLWWPTYSHHNERRRRSPFSKLKHLMVSTDKRF